MLSRPVFGHVTGPVTEARVRLTLKKRPLTYKGVTIRPRGESWQVDFGELNAHRMQRSCRVQKDAMLAIGTHVAKPDAQEANQRGGALIFMI